ncbi:SCO3374 family protein [Streptomyces sp. WSLK1-5]|uniref:SCO3374 family protein n=1 Tax=unclassified Streptomyces TaxID=2593676 RepID=UPI00379DFA31
MVAGHLPLPTDLTAVPRPRRAPDRAASSDDPVRRWYENELEWPTVPASTPGSPVRLRLGLRFDVLDVPAEAGRAALRHLVAGSPVALWGDRMLLLVAAGSTEEVPGILEWLEWSPLTLDLRAIGTGASMLAPPPPETVSADFAGAPWGPEGRAGTAWGRRPGEGRHGEMAEGADGPGETAGGSPGTPGGPEGLAETARAHIPSPGTPSETVRGQAVRALGLAQAPQGPDGPAETTQRQAPRTLGPARATQGPGPLASRPPMPGAAGLTGAAQGRVPGASAGRSPASRAGGPAALSVDGRAGEVPGALQGAAVWLRPPEPGCEVEASLPTVSALGGGGGAPDLVRVVNTVATQCHRLRLRHARA